MYERKKKKIMNECNFSESITYNEKNEKIS